MPRQYQHRVLFLGVLGALVFCAIFIAGGSALIAATLYAERFADGAAPEPRQALGKIHEQLARQRDADASTDPSDPSGATDR